MTLRDVSRPHDLPPLWDERRVKWLGWEVLGPTTMHLHVPLDESCCRKCGSLDVNEPRNIGIVHPLPGETAEELVEKRLPSGRTYLQGPTPVAVKPLRRLFATRCPDCGHDTVLDMETNECFDLEPEDYTDNGSFHPDNPPQGALW